MLEKTYVNKLTEYNDTSKLNFSNLLYVEGHFETEKYFKNFNNNLKSMFIIKDNAIIKLN